MVETKRILLIVGGGIAAYKSLELVRLISKAGHQTQAILTRAGAEFVTPLSLQALTGHEVRSDLFDLTAENKMGHIELSRSADLIVVAPATADLMGKVANGLANDLASTTLLATDTPVLMAPAMNVRMWQHPAVMANTKTLREFGIAFVGPNTGDMACGEHGPGRMAEPTEILAAIENQLTHGQTLVGHHALVTAGPTAEALDPVRVLTNRSSGQQGFAIAGALARAGARVTLVAGPVHLPTPVGVDRVDVETADEMLAACERALPAEIAICTAAVSDWKLATPRAHKIKKGPDGPPQLTFTETPDILRTLSTHTKRPKLVIGFAAETQDLVANAQQKLNRKGCDVIVANSVADGAVFGQATTDWTLVTKAGTQDWGAMDKSDAASRLVTHIPDWL